MTDTAAAFDRPRYRPFVAPAGSEDDIAPSRRMFSMSNAGAQYSSNTAGWVTYTYAAFAISAGMTGLGVWALDADLWVKGYMAMGSVFLCGSTFTLAKTVRDEHEARRFTNRLEEAKTEKLLMEINRG
jgi:hypothetical protein